MQYLVYLMMSENEAMSPPTPEGMAALGNLMAESFESGMIVATGQVPATTTHLRLDSGEISLSDGPVIDGKLMIPGFTVIRADSKEEALSWAESLRRGMGDGTIRIAELSATGAEDLK